MDEQNGLTKRMTITGLTSLSETSLSPGVSKLVTRAVDRAFQCVTDEKTPDGTGGDGPLGNREDGGILPMSSCQGSCRVSKPQSKVDGNGSDNCSGGDDAFLENPDEDVVPKNTSIISGGGRNGRGSGKGSVAAADAFPLPTGNPDKEGISRKQSPKSGGGSNSRGSANCSGGDDAFLENPDEDVVPKNISIISGGGRNARGSGKGSIGAADAFPLPTEKPDTDIVYKKQSGGRDSRGSAKRSVGDDALSFSTEHPDEDVVPKNISLISGGGRHSEGSGRRSGASSKRQSDASEELSDGSIGSERSDGLPESKRQSVTPAEEAPEFGFELRRATSAEDLNVESEKEPETASGEEDKRSTGGAHMFLTGVPPTESTQVLVPVSLLPEESLYRVGHTESFVQSHVIPVESEMVSAGLRIHRNPGSVDLDVIVPDSNIRRIEEEMGRRSLLEDQERATDSPGGGGESPGGFGGFGGFFSGDSSPPRSPDLVTSSQEFKTLMDEMASQVAEMAIDGMTNCESGGFFEEVFKKFSEVAKTAAKMTANSRRTSTGQQPQPTTGTSAGTSSGNKGGKSKLPPEVKEHVLRTLSDIKTQLDKVKNQLKK